MSSVFVHFFHVDGERGEVDYERILGPFEGIQLTHYWLRETEQGDDIAWLEDGDWRLPVDQDPRPFSDVCFLTDKPKSVAG